MASDEVHGGAIPLEDVLRHRVLAPVCCHAGLNVGLCARDWGRMRRTPANVLRRTFSVAKGRDTFGLD